MRICVFKTVDRLAECGASQDAGVGVGCGLATGQRCKITSMFCEPLQASGFFVSMFYNQGPLNMGGNLCARAAPEADT